MKYSCAPLHEFADISLLYADGAKSSVPIFNYEDLLVLCQWVFTAHWAVMSGAAGIGRGVRVLHCLQFFIYAQLIGYTLYGRNDNGGFGRWGWVG